MKVYEIDPITDARWGHLLQSHPQASIFHTREWLEALNRTYRYAPIVFTTSPPDSTLTNGVPFCRLKGLFGSQRLVSLPFSDHCTPLLENPEQFNVILWYLQNRAAREDWRYFELRPADPFLRNGTDLCRSDTFFVHKLDLTPSLDEIFRKLHKDCIQRKIQRAARERLVHEEGNSSRQLQQFYDLVLLTRRRQGLPAQPVAWFRALVDCLGENVRIHVALKDGRPTASIMTLRYKDCLTYKYGCSDRSFSNLGGMQFLFWKAIQSAKKDGLTQFDMGRTDTANAGLIAFKERWGAGRMQIEYLRNTARSSATYQRRVRVGKYVLGHAPTEIVAAAGKLFYRYLG